MSRPFYMGQKAILEGTIHRLERQNCDLLAALDKIDKLGNGTPETGDTAAADLRKAGAIARGVLNKFGLPKLPHGDLQRRAGDIEGGA